MIDWDDLKYCLALTRHKTMTAAGKSLNANVATVSRRLEQLSADLGEALFIKQNGQWMPTDKGLMLSRIAEETESRLVEESSAYRIRQARRAVIRISVMLPILQSGLVDGLPEFLAEHADLDVDLTTASKSLALGEVDMTLSLRTPTEGRVVRAKIGTLPHRAYRHASQEGPIEGWVSFSQIDEAGPMEAAMERKFGKRSRVHIHGMNVGAVLLERMPLVGFLPTNFAERRPDLVPWGDMPEMHGADIWLSYHQTRRRDPLVATAVAFVRGAFGRPAEATG